MSPPTVSRLVKVVNPQGVHARPAYLLAKLAKEYRSDVHLRKESVTADAKSILSLLTLAAEHGTELEVVARGDDADRAVAALAELIERGFENETSDSSAG